MSQDLATIDSGPTVKVPAKPTKKQRQALIDAKAFEKFGVHALRVKTKVLSALGKEADEWGLKHIGNGKVIVASGHAEDSIARLGAMIDKLATADKPDFELILELMRLQREFNAQLILTAQVHLNLAKSSTPDSNQGLTITTPFPSGAPLMIAVGNKPEPQQQ